MFAAIVVFMIVGFFLVGGLVILAKIAEDWQDIKNYFQKRNDIKLEKIRLENDLKKEKMRLEFEKDKRAWDLVGRSEKNEILKELEAEGERIRNSSH